MIYICQAPPVPGKFDNAKAKELQIPNGPLKGQLVKGEAIEYPDPANPGTIKRVEPEDVVSGGRDGAVGTVSTTELTPDPDRRQLYRSYTAFIT